VKGSKSQYTVLDLTRAKLQQAPYLNNSILYSTTLATMTELCFLNHNESLLRGDTINPLKYSVNNDTQMTGEMAKPKSDDQSVVTARTVNTSYDEDDCCDYSETDSCEHGHESSNTFGGLQCVSFNEVIETRETIARWEFTADETEAGWYSRREREVMREAAYGIAESLDYSYFQDEYGQPTSTNFRGLESYTVEGGKQRKLHRVKNLVAVLREQRRQRACGEVVTNGPELLEGACRSLSSRRQKLAHKQAKRDEIDARGGKQKGNADQSPSMMLYFSRLLRDLNDSNEWASGD